MIGKFLFICLVAASAVQAASYSSSETRNAIDDIRKFLEDIIEKIKGVIADIPNFIENIKKAIKQAIDNINIPGDIADIKKKINDILEKYHKTADDAAQCISTASQTVVNITKTAENDGQQCSIQGWSQLDRLLPKLLEIKTKVEQLVIYIGTQMARCMLHPLDVEKCLKTEKDDVVKNWTEIEGDREQLEANATQVVTETIDCATKVGENLKEASANTVNNFEDCVKNLS